MYRLILVVLVIVLAIAYGAIIVQGAVARIGADPYEGFRDLDVEYVYCGVVNSTYLYLNVTVYDVVFNISGVDKFWAFQLDVDLDSRLNGTWDYEYVAVIRLNGTGGLTGALYTGNYTYLMDLNVSGGNGTRSVGVYIPLTSINASSLLYVKVYTQNNTLEKDHAPYNDTGGGGLGDYYVCWLTTPRVTWANSIDDPVGDVNVSYLDITLLNSTLNSTGLYLLMELYNNTPWYGGDVVGIYEFFLDVDHNSSTGYYFYGIGADYMVEYVVGYIPRLYVYTGNGSSWNWSLVGLVDPLNVIGGSNNVSLFIPLSEIGSTSVVDVIGYSTRSLDWLSDVTLPVVAPIPEDYFIPLAMLSSIIVFLLLYGSRCRGKVSHC